MEHIDSPEENLRSIRRLMERATIYRAISAPTALLAGVLSASVGAAFAVLGLLGRECPDSVYAAAWAGVCLIVLVVNSFFIWRKSRDRGELYFSSGMRLALRAFVPPMAAGVIATGWFLVAGEGRALLISSWAAFYGLALLAMREFAPRSIVRLGTAFLTAGLGIMPAAFALAGPERAAITGHVAMILIFGGVHLAYAAVTWPRRRYQAEVKPLEF